MLVEWSIGLKDTSIRESEKWVWNMDDEGKDSPTADNINMMTKVKDHFLFNLIVN